MALTAVLLFQAGSGLNFYADEWAFIQLRREWTLENVLAPHRDHISVVPVLIYKALFATVGISEYWPYLAVIVASHLLTAGLVFAYARRRLEDGPALAAAALVLFLGAGWENLVWGFQVGFVLPVAAAAGMLLAFDRRDRVGDALASALLGLGLASSALGLALIVPACLELLDRQRRWRQLWIVGVPLGLYLVWWSQYWLGEAPASSKGLSWDIPAAVGFAARLAAAGVGGLTGLGAKGYVLLALVGIVLLVTVLVTRRHASIANLVPLRVMSLAALTVAYLGVIALGRAHTSPFTSRYVYGSAIFILLLGVELARGIRLERPWLAAVGLFVALAVWGNYGLFRDGIRAFERFDRELSPRLAALEIAGPRTRPDFSVGQGWVIAFFYFRAVEDFGSPADNPRELLRSSESARLAADETLVRALGLKAESGRAARTTGPPPRVIAAGGTVRRRDSCVLYRGGDPGIDLIAPATGILVRSEPPGTAAIRVRRFANQYRKTPVATVSRAAAVRLPKGGSGVPWKVRASGAAGLELCTLAR